MLSRKDQEPSVSVYKICVSPESEIIMEKIALRGESSIGVGDFLGAGNESYQRTLGLSYNFGFQRYEKLKNKRVDEVNTVSWGAGSTGIVGLFTTRAEALKCFKQKNLQHWDGTYFDSTSKVLKKIGAERESQITLDSYLAGAVTKGDLEKIFLFS